MLLALFARNDDTVCHKTNRFDSGLDPRQKQASTELEDKKVLESTEQQGKVRQGIGQAAVRDQ
jgi:hypothetical protein